MTAEEFLGRIRPAHEIESLGELASFEDMVAELGRAASAIGKISSIAPLMVSTDRSGDECGFLVNFERAQDAMAASRQWHCFQFGFTSVAVSIRCKAARANGKGTAST